MIKILDAIIFYFESSCEICLANRGIEKHRKEVSDLMKIADDFDDTIKLRIYYAYALIEYKTDNRENAFKGWWLALQYAQKVDDQIYLGKIYSFLAISYYIKGNKEQEVHFFSLAEDIFKKQQNYEELANHYINILWYKRYEKDKKEVVEYLDKASNFVRLADGKKNARVYLHLGYIYKTIFSDYTKCIGYLIKSNELSREFGFTEMESMTFHVLADVYTKIEKPIETIKIYKEIMHNEKFKDITANLKAAVLCNLIGCYIKTGDLKNAEKYLSMLSEVQSEVQINIKEQYRAVMLGLKAEYTNLAGGDNEYALAMIEEAEGIFKEFEKNFVMEEFPYLTASRKGDIYLGLKEYGKAISSYLDMERIACNLGKYELKAAYEKLAHVYELIDDYRQSLSYYKKADRVCSEIRHYNMDIQYETMYKEFIKEVKEKEKHNLRMTNINLEKESNVDALTNVLNRNYLSSYIAEQEKSPLKDKQMSVMMIDLDYFKEFNDSCGHIKGDEVLKAVAAVFLKNCRNTDKIIRYGGDEFLIILGDTSKTSAINLAQKILEDIRKVKIADNMPDISHPVTVSIGIASLKQGDGLEIERMIREADQALYQSKNKGKGTYTHLDELS